ncbi:hypothetical protein MNBD_CHLOROFLEXI01-99 [hydrothermal vent metagenome]|uniref:Tetratricopeptide repeat protein n=1 Tax=hydrothermal vent metagenome TaxID=652676 RepID=A0A3B0WGS3_9ZZZZ
MNDKLKEAIQTVQAGDKQEAQRQLTELLEDNPQQVQGWYLLSLLVDSPQKQAAYLSKTLALNPQHLKAKEQLEALQTGGSLAATTTIEENEQTPLTVVKQSETDALPDWLSEGADALTPVEEPESDEETAVSNETLPEWLKEPAALGTDLPETTEEAQTAVGQTTKSTSEPDKAIPNLKQPSPQSPSKPTKASRSAPQNARSLNVILGILVILAIIVMVVLAYLLLS